MATKTPICCVLLPASLSVDPHTCFLCCLYPFPCCANNPAGAGVFVLRLGEYSLFLYRQFPCCYWCFPNFPVFTTESVLVYCALKSWSDSPDKILATQGHSLSILCPPNCSGHSLALYMAWRGPASQTARLSLSLSNAPHPLSGSLIQEIWDDNITLCCKTPL